MKRRGHGEGTIFLRSDGRWAASVTLPDGRRKSFYAKTRRAAQAKLAEANVALQQGHDLGKAVQRVGDYLDAWLRSAKRRVRPSTWDSYALNIERLRPYVGHLKLAELRPTHLDEAYSQLLASGLSACTVGQAHRVIRAALRRAVNTDLILKTPTAAASPPRAKRREMQTLDPEQVRILFESTATHRLSALWVLLVTTGMRSGEAAALTWDDIGAKTIAVRRSVQRERGRGLFVGAAKTEGSRRHIELAPEALEALQHHHDRQKLERRKAWISGLTKTWCSAPKRASCLTRPVSTRA
jgi:integrase